MKICQYFKSIYYFRYAGSRQIIVIVMLNAAAAALRQQSTGKIDIVKTAGLPNFPFARRRDQRAG
jgi:hypothetical protein